MDVQLWHWLAIPLIGGLIGWLTNMLAVRMIFRPRRPRRILGLRLQGLIPRRQPELAAAVGHTVEQHLISHADVRRALSRADIRADIEALLHERVSTLIDTQLARLHPMIGVMLGGATRDKLEALMMIELEAVLPELGERMLDSVESELNFQKIIEEKVRAFELDRLEAIVLEVAGRELKAIELLGGLLGLLIGTAQVALLAL